MITKLLTDFTSVHKKLGGEEAGHAKQRKTVSEKKPGY
jgi:hypothetical protein